MRAGNRFTRSAPGQAKKRALPLHVQTTDRSKRASTRNRSKQSISKNDSLQRTSNTQTHSPSSPQTSKINEQQQFQKKQSETFIDNHKEKFNIHSYKKKASPKMIMNNNPTRNHYLSQNFINLKKLILIRTRLRMYMNCVL